jgi:hypothetical protein
LRVPYVERFQKAFASASKDIPGTTVTPSSSSVHSGSVVVLSAARASLVLFKASPRPRNLGRFRSSVTIGHPSPADQIEAPKSRNGL